MEGIRDFDIVKELLKTKQYTSLRQKMAEMNAADIAVVLEEMDEEDLLKVFRILPKNMAADVFSYLEVDSQQFIITSLSEKDAAGIIDNLMADDATDLLEEMPANVVKKLLANANPDTRRDINHLLRYPEDSAGSIMTVEYVDLKENMTVEDAISRIRKVGMDSETINICYVLDAKRTLVGTVALRYLLISPGDAVIGDIMHENVIFINTMMDQEEVARQFQKYDFTAMPVVDNENRLVGIITVDDVVDILQEEATEDMEKMAAIVPSDKPYMKTSVIETWKKRMPWLLLLMISAAFTGSILTTFEDALMAYGVLIAYIPMLMDTGGNAGGQASVTIIRGLSLNEIEFKDGFRVLWKEMRVALLCGITLSAANFVKLLLLDKVSLPVALVVCLTLVAAVLIAKVVGCMLPMLAKKIGFDPAVMASPFITTIVDVLSLLVYFQIATHLLHIA
ncbi:magnesium transporter [Parablautia intestinalis]|jgi:magnesium transporter|uniref:magnesium transporter n=1 Tax=Parablautia intestinalis TaxID=2320100 RepID=UPI00256EE638|nr:magnesium transporter [Parablautia intestinalis]MCI8613652.1 magnesium transporter [Lachnospiraceae bacterium]